MQTNDDDRQRLHASLKKVADEELELRVGTQISKGLSSEQLEEFEALIDRDKERLAAWLYSNSPDFENDPEFKRLESLMPETSDPLELVAEYAASKWLGLHCPEYRKITEAELSALAEDILAWVERSVKRPGDDAGRSE